jgi:adenylate kinase family enzyme
MNQIEQDIKYIKENFGESVTALDAYLKSHKLLMFFLTPKMGGKSTYIGLLKELFPDKFSIVSAGDLIREIQQMPEEQAVSLLTPIFPDNTDTTLIEIQKSNVKNLVSDITVYKLLLSAIDSPPSNRSLTLDGFPRTLAQLDLSFNLVEQLKPQGYTPFVLNIVISDAVLDKRMNTRRVCPRCGLVGNLETLHTLNVEDVKYDSQTKSFFLSCPKCQERFVKKTTDTELSEMTERRAREKEVYKKMGEIALEKQINFAEVKTDVLVKDFAGDDLQLNLSNCYTLDTEGKVISSTTRFTAQSPQGEVYAYHPRYVVGLITNSIASLLNC